MKVNLRKNSRKAFLNDSTLYFTKGYKPKSNKYAKVTPLKPIIKHIIDVEMYTRKLYLNFIDVIEVTRTIDVKTINPKRLVGSIEQR